MTAEDKKVALFTTRVRQLLLQYEQLKKQNAALQEELAKREQAIEDLEAKLSSVQSNYNSLMTAKMLEISGGDMESAKARLSHLIRSVNKCITLLSEK